MNGVLVVGAGPAGSAASIAARLRGSPVRLVDRAAAIRHKVCGEFLSPGAPQILEDLHVWNEFLALEPHCMRRCVLHFGKRRKEWRLPECGWGMSRLRLDRLLVEKAAALGATVSLGERVDWRTLPPGTPTVAAFGRTQTAKGPDRLFGFKAHFEGPTDDAVELFFDRSGYAGVSGIENHLTNVCAMAPESVLRRCGFNFDEAIRRSPALADRLLPLRRRMDWIVTGPLTFGTPPAHDAKARAYPAGDALNFIDPFTGSGILNALLTGRLAGAAAAEQISGAEYLRACGSLLGRPFFAASVLRRLLAHTELHWLAPCLPGQLVFRMTRAFASRGLRVQTPGWSRT